MCPLELKTRRSEQHLRVFGNLELDALEGGGRAGHEHHLFYIAFFADAEDLRAHATELRCELIAGRKEACTAI